MLVVFFCFFFYKKKRFIKNLSGTLYPTFKECVTKIRTVIFSVGPDLGSNGLKKSLADTH